MRNVATDAGATGAAAYVDIDRDTASRLSITAASIDDALYSAFGQRIVSTIFTETNQYRVILEAQPDAGDVARDAGHGCSCAPARRADAAVGGGPHREQRAPLQITHVAQYPATTVGFDTAPGVSLGKAVDAIRAAAEGHQAAAGGDA